MFPSWALDILFVLLGAIWGSFANVVILRLPSEESVATPRSHCRTCSKSIAWYDNIPIFSWFILRGRCRHCGARFSFRYPLVEFLMALGFWGLFHVIGLNWLLLEYVIMYFGLVVVSFIDFDHMILPDVFTLSGIVLGLLGSWLNPERHFLDALIGVISGGGFLWLVAHIYWLIRKEEGMGGGDIKLLAWMGAVLGWKAIPFIIISSSVIGSIVGIFVAMKQRKGLKISIPFGPYLALGAVIFIFFGEALGSMEYIRLFFPWVDN